jgi:hypothetical protein
LLIFSSILKTLLVSGLIGNNWNQVIIEPWVPKSEIVGSFSDPTKGETTSFIGERSVETLAVILVHAFHEHEVHKRSARIDDLSRK